MARRLTRAQPAQTGRSSISTPFPFTELSAPIAARVRAQGVLSCQDWIDLGHRRHEIFGIVTRAVERIDDLVRQTLIDAAGPPR